MIHTFTLSHFLLTPTPSQTDKQRIIWAYKILFLDVLFPLSVDRIIFVDSDQVRGGKKPKQEEVCVGGLTCSP